MKHIVKHLGRQNVIDGKDVEIFESSEILVLISSNVQIVHNELLFLCYINP